jgi:hypothetical protein
MSRPLFNALATTAVVGASLVGATADPAWAAPAPHGRVAPNTIVAYETGYGATLAAAEQSARAQLLGDYYGCGTVYLISDKQLADGTWSATMGANCSGLR